MSDKSKEARESAARRLIRKFGVATAIKRVLAIFTRERKEAERDG